MGGLTDFVDKSCETYSDNAWNAYDQMRNLENTTRGPYNDASRRARKLLGGVPSPPGMVDSALSDLKNDVNSKVPDLSDADTLNEILKRCTPLKNLMDGAGSLNDALDYMGDMVSDLAGDAFDAAISGIMSAIPEFNASLDMLGCDDFFKNMKVPEFLGVLDGLLDCISNMCPGPSTDYLLDKALNLQDEMFFTDDGTFDRDRMLADVGVSPAQTANLTKLQDSMATIRADAITDIEGQVTTLFDNVKKAKKNKYLGKISSYF